MNDTSRLYLMLQNVSETWVFRTEEDEKGVCKIIWLSFQYDILSHTTGMLLKIPAPQCKTPSHISVNMHCIHFIINPLVTLRY